MFPRSIIMLVTALAAAPPSLALDANRPEVQTFVKEMNAQYGVDKTWLRDLLTQAVHQETIVDAISRPAERVRPWYEYRELFLTQERIDAGVAYWLAHATDL